MRHRGAWIFLCGLCATVLILALMLHSKQGQLDRATEPKITFESAEEDMTAQTLRTTWKSARGTEEVITPKLSDESYADFLARHNALVALAQEANPPVN